MRDDDDARDGDDDDDDDAVVEAEEAHARAVAKHLFSKLERHERVESTTTTTSAADESRSNAARENERALVSLMDKRARDASALDAARARIRELEWERDEARRARGELARKCQRLHARAKIQEMETAKLRSAVVAATSSSASSATVSRGVAANARLRAPRDAREDGSPESVGFEYHRAVCEAFERKITSLIDEIERARRSSASVRDASPPREATSPPARSRETQVRATSPRARSISRAETTPTPTRAETTPTIDVVPFTPTMGPLDALLTKIALSPR